MYGTSVFTDILKELCRHSEKVDMQDVTDEDFASLQKLEPRIINAYRECRFRSARYIALMNIYNTTMEAYRYVLGYNEVYERNDCELDEDDEDDD